MKVHADIYPMVLYDDKAWVISGEDNFLYNVDLKNWEATYVVEVQSDKEDVWRGNYVGLEYKSKIICIPDRNDKIGIYDIVNEKMEYIQMPQNITTRWSIDAHILDGDILYLISQVKNMILKVDLKHYSVEICDCIESGKKIVYVLAKEKEFVYIIQEDKLNLYRYNVLNGKVKKTFISEECYDVMCCDGDNIWFSGRKKKVLCWNEQTNQTKEVDLSTLDICEYNLVAPKKDTYVVTKEKDFCHQIFYKQCVYGEYVYFFPYHTNHVLRVNTKNFTVEKIDFENEIDTADSLQKRINGLEHYKFFLEMIDNEGYVYVYSFKNEVHYKIDNITGKVKEIKPQIKVLNEEKAMNMLLTRGKMFRERMDFSLKELLRMKNR